MNTQIPVDGHPRVDVAELRFSWSWLVAGPAPRCLVVVAHPDDETISVGAHLSRLAPQAVVHITDGAPRDRRFFPAGLDVCQERYAAIRREEVIRALSLAGVPGSRIISFSAIDQEAVFELPRLVQRLFALLCDLRPEIVITHAYEGGHPDHDATALAVHAAVVLAPFAGLRSPLIFEATSYHGAGGRFAAGEFLPFPGCSEVTMLLSKSQKELKGAMVSCFSSQEAVLTRFPVRVESFRVAPAYDFTRPPHEGMLYYEQLGFPLTGEQWRELAGGAFERLGLARRRCL